MTIEGHEKLRQVDEGLDAMAYIVETYDRHLEEIAEELESLTRQLKEVDARYQRVHEWRQKWIEARHALIVAQSAALPKALYKQEDGQ
jgi:DNA repair ATPase RecN